MERTEVAVGGTLKADGTLELDHKPSLPAGRVTVVLRPAAELTLPLDDPFWQRMLAIWSIPRTPGHSVDGGENTLQEVQRGREEWDERQRALEHVQEGSDS